MNVFSPLYSLRILLMGLLALAVGGSSLSAQSQSQATASAGIRASNFEGALAAFVAGDTAGGERALFQNNTSKPDLIDWNIECASRLIQMALVLRERADFATGNAVGARALEYVTDAKLHRFMGAKARRRAQVLELAGFIYERLMIDPVLAKAAFLDAQREAPGSKAAQAGLERLKNQEDQIARLPGGKG
jgi:hypothetical protein